MKNDGAHSSKRSKKKEIEATEDLKKTLAAPSEKIFRILRDLGPISQSIWEPKSMQNRIEF